MATQANARLVKEKGKLQKLQTKGQIVFVQAGSELDAFAC